MEEKTATMQQDRDVEFWDLYDRKGNFVRKMQRGVGYVPPELYHITVEVIATDKAGHILVTRRAFEKKRDGGLWEFPAGSVLSGENPSNAALRELAEETGVKPVKLRLFHKSLIPGLMRYAYFAYVPDLMNVKVTLQPGEAMDYRIVTISEWHEMLGKGLFSNQRLQNYTEKFFEEVDRTIGVPASPAPPPATPRKSAGTIRKVSFGQE